jgi:hypothetical protein
VGKSNNVMTIILEMVCTNPVQVTCSMTTAVTSHQGVCVCELLITHEVSKFLTSNNNMNRYKINIVHYDYWVSSLCTLARESARCVVVPSQGKNTRVTPGCGIVGVQPHLHHRGQFGVHGAAPPRRNIYYRPTCHRCPSH